MERISYLGESIARWKIGPSTFLAFPERGARLMNWHVELADGSMRDVIYWPDLENLTDFHRIRGGNPILFPFCARTFDQGEIQQWRAPDGIRRPMPMHGIARQGTFEVLEIDEHGFTAQLVPGPDAAAIYPYDYEFLVIYRFRPLGLAVEFSLKNLGTQPIPWSAGHHFYFSLPWEDGLTRADYQIEIPAKKTHRQNARGELVDGPAPKSPDSFANPDLVDRIHTHLKTDTVTFGAKRSNNRVAMRIGTQDRPPPSMTVVTWSPDETAPFYCVEPWMGPPNSPENKFGLHSVPAGKTQTFAVEISIG